MPAISKRCTRMEGQMQEGRIDTKWTVCIDCIHRKSNWITLIYTCNWSWSIMTLLTTEIMHVLGIRYTYIYIQTIQTLANHTERLLRPTWCMNSCVARFQIMVVGYHFIIKTKLLHTNWRKVLAIPCMKSTYTTTPQALPPLPPPLHTCTESFHLSSHLPHTLQRHSTLVCLPSKTLWRAGGKLFMT